MKRQLTSLTLLTSGTVVGLSGAILFVLPREVWFLGLDRGGYKDLHQVFMVPFLIAAVLHCIWNWKPLLSHCKPSPSTLGATRAGVAVVALVTALLLVGTLARVSPLTDFLAWGYSLSHGTQGPRPGGYPPPMVGGQGGERPGAGDASGSGPTADGAPSR